MKIELEVTRSEGAFILALSIIATAGVLASQYGSIILGWFVDA